MFNFQGTQQIRVKPGVKGGDMLGHPVVLEHVEQGRLSGVVESEEEQFAGLLPEADVGQDVAEPIPEEHLELAMSAARPGTKVTGSVMETVQSRRGATYY